MTGELPCAQQRLPAIGRPAPLLLARLCVFLLLSGGALPIAALDYPHNAANSIDCRSCHQVHQGVLPSWLPSSVQHVPENLDNTPRNSWCWSCHNDIVAPFVKTHSSLAVGSKYGSWSVECTTCHEVHKQRQLQSYGSASDLFAGVLTAVSPQTMTMAGAGWTPDRWAGNIVIGDIADRSVNYHIVSNTIDTLTVTGTVDQARSRPGDAFAIAYGGLIRATVTTPSSGPRAVRFFADTGSYSFADGDSTYDGICEICHTQTGHFRNDGSAPDQNHANIGGGAGRKCTTCHTHAAGFAFAGHTGATGGSCGTATTCHGTQGSHAIHVGPQLGLGCATCHDTANLPLFNDAQDLAITTACSPCHSPGGSYDGVNDTVVGAKNNWETGVYAGAELKPGKEHWCITCHDEVPSVVQGRSAPNKVGNNSSYGYYVTGHGRPATYPAMSWQATSGDSGNPGANQSCTNCHDASAPHIGASSERLRYPNNQDNTLCTQCHEPGGPAHHSPDFYTTSAAFETSAHAGALCTDCHEVHGTSSAAMTKANKEGLCDSCHSGHAGHALHVEFATGGKSYSLECVSCHNVHIVTGLTSAANPNVSALTRFTNNTAVWGDKNGQKMSNYAGSGKYQTPSGDVMDGTQLPDYVTFCLDCHSTPQAEFGPHGSISWSSDNHGLVSANVPNGGGAAPNWFSFGVAEGWDGDDCTGAQAQCWPVIPRGRGEMVWSRSAYAQQERIAGVNFVLSCSDCHVTHEAGIGAKMRATINGNPGGRSHNTLCNACHYYYSDWHAGMSCGNAGCHNAGNWGPRDCDNCNTIHGMYHASGAGSTRTWNGALVLDLRFEGGLNDSGSFRLHGRWYSAAGSFAAGRVGQAAVFGEDVGVAVGTKDNYWSTDEGKHGTWKYTEMKYATTLEAWVNPNDDSKSEYTIFRKHTGYDSGGYGFSLKQVGATLRAAFNMQADNNGFAQGGAAGVRGAYSAVAVPLNRWTHVAAVFDGAGPDRNPADPRVGRVRIYVDGEDVTTSDATGNSMQPEAGETSIFAYSENSPWNQTICYQAQWCASEFAVGGFDWEATNFLGMIDEAKVWNVSKDAGYFAAVDAQSAPRISTVTGMYGSDELEVLFSEGVYATTGGSLQPDDFTLTDLDDGRTIVGVSHGAGAGRATVRLSAPLDTANDAGVDALAPASTSVFDEYDNAAATDAVTITVAGGCPSGETSFQFDEPAATAAIVDQQQVLFGAVNDPAQTLSGDGYYTGDGVNNYVDFEYNPTCLQASTSMTIEARIKPTGLAGTAQYVKRVFARDGGGNYQMSVWRNNSWAGGTFNAPSGTAAIAFWVSPVDAHGGSAWKPVLTDYVACPIVSDHWYRVKAVWSSNKPGGVPGQFFVPADIYVDDEGTDGSGTGESWSGSANCTNSSQSYSSDISKLYTGDQIKTADGAFTIGANVTNHANNVFQGLIDWIKLDLTAPAGTLGLERTGMPAVTPTASAFRLPTTVSQHTPATPMAKPPDASTPTPAATATRTPAPTPIPTVTPSATATPTETPAITPPTHSSEVAHPRPRQRLRRSRPKAAESVRLGTSPGTRCSWPPRGRDCQGTALPAHALWGLPRRISQD
ncbi:MAG: hypothetical protein HY699_09510 [Deltaproteobacteria bacterium]|nr:hypothetical protein [Deltaproteobacteria bacterium]